MATDMTLAVKGKAKLLVKPVKASSTHEPTKSREANYKQKDYAGNRWTGHGSDHGWRKSGRNWCNSYNNTGGGRSRGKGHVLPRTRLTEEPISGTLVEWKGKF